MKVLKALVQDLRMNDVLWEATAIIAVLLEVPEDESSPLLQTFRISCEYAPKEPITEVVEKLRNIGIEHALEVAPLVLMRRMA